jgi:putative tryptophan/tyrosine transport system substrate-binding protein
MRRRDFIAALGAAIAWPLSVRAQQLPVIGFMSSRSSDESKAVVAKFLESLAEAGFVAGKNVAIEYRWADGQYERLPALAAELVARNVTVILAAGGPPSALAAKAATSAIPIVFSGSSDAVGLGIVRSLSRPGGNITGISHFNVSLAGKRLENLRELIPAADSLCYLINPANPSAEIERGEALKGAAALGMRVEILKASTEAEIEAAFGAAAAMKAGGVVVASEPFFDSRRDMIVATAARHAMPASYGWREYAIAGGLVSYGSSLPNSYREAGHYVARILKGEKPADLPVLQPTKFELVINLKTARTLGITVPPALLASADEVIE